MMTIVCNVNDFSLSKMIPGEENTLFIKEVSEYYAVQSIRIGPYKSAVRDQKTADVLSVLTRTTFPVDRRNVILERHQAMLAIQYDGPRLQKGAWSLPENATVRWLLITHQEWVEHPTEGKTFFPDANHLDWVWYLRRMLEI